ncbi:MAG: isoprenylcysteine carboxylmethyltransferase family protein [Christensenella sp.]|nr:isoprenylcysteine carboxylmethyltransferase family protein [Christensenella sp.]
MNQKANFYIVRVLSQRVIGFLLFFFFARWVPSVRSMVYFSLYFVFAIVSLAMVRSVSPATLAARGRLGDNTPVWDRILLAFYWLLTYFVIYILAGLEASRAPALGWVFGVGVLLQVAASLLTLWAVRVNPFLESSARIQRDRCQSVCNCGPYSAIRHPTYAAILLWCVGVSLVFETLFTAVCAGVIAILVILRTVLEDRMLRAELAGYQAYAAQVKHRLIPYIW